MGATCPSSCLQVAEARRIDRFAQTLGVVTASGSVWRRKDESKVLRRFEHRLWRKRPSLRRVASSARNLGAFCGAIGQARIAAHRVRVDESPSVDRDAHAGRKRHDVDDDDAIHVSGQMAQRRLPPFESYVVAGLREVAHNGIRLNLQVASRLALRRASQYSGLHARTERSRPSKNSRSEGWANLTACNQAPSVRMSGC